MAKYNFRNLCEMFETSIEAVLGSLEAGKVDKAKHRCKEILLTIERLKKKNGRQSKAS